MAGPIPVPSFSVVRPTGHSYGTAAYVPSLHFVTYQVQPPEAASGYRATAVAALPARVGTTPAGQFHGVWVYEPSDHSATTQMHPSDPCCGKLRTQVVRATIAGWTG